jgi:hypothetical protein
LGIHNPKDKMKTKILCSMAATVAVTLVSTLQVQAQLQTNSDRVVIIFPGLAPVDITLPEGGATATEFLPAFAPAPGLPDQGVIMFEPGTPAGALSDAIWVQQGFFYFESDVNEQLTHVPPTIPFGPPIAETGLLQDLSPLFHTSTGAPLPLGTVQVQSDLEVPEPSTMALASFGLLALLMKLRSRKA